MVITYARFFSTMLLVMIVGASLFLLVPVGNAAPGDSAPPPPAAAGSGAGGGFGGGVPEVSGLAAGDLKENVSKLITAFLGILGTVALGLILYGGYTWMTAQGNTEDVQKAQKIITEATIGLIIIALSAAIARFVLQGLTGL